MGPLSITEINLSFRLSRREVADRLKFLEAKDYILYGKDGHWTLADKGREYLIEQRLV